jgi:flotillin
MNEAQFIGISIGLGAFGVMLLIIFLKANVILCQPNELVVVAGRQRKGKDGSPVGYRVIRGGRGFKFPLVESVARLSLTSLPIELNLSKAMSQGMIPLNVHGRATVKLAGRPENGMDAAIERFLGKGPDAVTKTAKQALEGALRGVVATMTPEEANAQRLDLATKAAERARADLRPLGIVLDFLQVQEITDDHEYLEAIGRRQNARVKRDARMAEATADAEARKVAAEQRLAGRQAEIAADLQIVEEENTLSVKRSQLQAAANEAAERAAVAGAIAKAEQKVVLEEKRARQSERKQEAETIIPARAAREAAILRAQGEAAQITEDGKATAEAVESMRAQWADGRTRDLFMIRMLPDLVEHVSRVVAENLRIDKLTIVDGGDGEGLSNYVKNITKSAVTVMEQMENATGVDLAKLSESGRRAPPIPPQL